MTPWPALIRLAMQMGITPDAFWRLSLVEWRALTGGEAEALSRAAFETLARQYPDENA